MTDTLIVTSEETSTADNKLTHYVCCFDENLTFCGKRDVSEWVTEPNPADMCIVCVDLHEDELFCPKFAFCCDLNEHPEA